MGRFNVQTGRPAGPGVSQQDLIDAQQGVPSLLAPPPPPNTCLLYTSPSPRDS